MLFQSLPYRSRLDSLGLTLTTAGTARLSSSTVHIERLLRGHRITLDRIFCAFLPQILDHDVEPLYFALGGHRGQEGLDHRRLKLHLALLVRAMNADADLHFEVRHCETSRLRADAVATWPDGSRVFGECGSTDDVSILGAFESGANWVIALPFSTLNHPGLLGYVFRHPRTPPLISPAVAAARATWHEMRTSPLASEMAA